VAGEFIESHADVGAAACGFGVEDFADDAEAVGAAFAGSEEEFGDVAEEEEADFVLILGGAEGEEGGDFCGEFAFGDIDAAEVLGGADVDGEEDGEFAFFDEFLDEGEAHAGGDVPVDAADLVAWLVFAEVVEVDTLAFEYRVVFAADGGAHDATRDQFDLADFFEDLGKRISHLELMGEGRRWGKRGIGPWRAGGRGAGSGEGGRLQPG